MILTLALIGHVVPKLRLTAAFVLLGVPSPFLADAGGEVGQVGGWVAIVAALFAGLVALVGAIADGIVKVLESRRGAPTTAEVAAAERILERARAQA